jgi:hypothetical protein
VLAIAGAASAQDTGDEWTFVFAPYAWATAVNGDTGVRGAAAHVDLSIGDVLDRVDGGLMGVFEVKKGRWGTTTDFIWASLSDSS